VTLNNTGYAALAITSITVTGTNSTDFSQSNTCGSSVAPGTTCTINVSFNPAATGARTASVRVYISTGKLAELANASEEGVESALDELQKKKLIDSDRPVGKPKHRGNKRYYFRLHQPSVAPAKKPAGSS
jgi:hypothetical protein